MPEFKERYFNPDAELPYNVSPDAVAEAIKDWYVLYHGLNEFLHDEGHHNIEALLRANNALSDFIGDILTDNFAAASPQLIKYAAEDYKVHHGDEGIETKCSQQKGGWQAQNNEEAWFVVFRYSPVDRDAEPENMDGLEIIQVLGAKLSEEDWSHSGRSDD